MPRNLKVHLAKNHQEADEWDIQQNLRMSPEERLRAARILQQQFFGKNSPDVKKSHIVPEKLKHGSQPQNMAHLLHAKRYPSTTPRWKSTIGIALRMTVGVGE